MVPIFVACVRKEYAANADISEAKLETNFSLHPVFRIRKCVSKYSIAYELIYSFFKIQITEENDSENCCMLFVDETARVYNTWEAYVNNNNLPRGIMVAPKRGVYVTETDTERVIVSLFRTPSSSPASILIGRVDIGSTFAGLGSSLVLIGSLFAPVVLAPVVAPAVAVGVGCGAYSVGRSVWSLFDRSNHEQTINPRDAEARANWFGVAGGATGMAAGGITNTLSYMVRSGQDIGMTMRAAANIANIAAMATNGCGVVNGFFGVFLRRRDGDDISTLDIVQLGASLFLFTHSVYNFQTASSLIDSTRNSTINSARQNLSRNQK